eukprot:846900-Rhodomonas_salina.3
MRRDAPFPTHKKVASITVGPQHLSQTRGRRVPQRNNLLRPVRLEVQVVPDDVVFVPQRVVALARIWHRHGLCQRRSDHYADWGT